MGSQSRVLPNVRTGKRRPATRAFFRGLVLSVAALMSALTCAAGAGDCLLRKPFFLSRDYATMIERMAALLPARGVLMLCFYVPWLGWPCAPFPPHQRGRSHACAAWAM